MRSSRPPAKSSPLSPRDTRQSGANAANGSVSSRPGPSPSSVRHGQKSSINVSGDVPMPSSPLAATTPLTSSTLSRNGQSPQSPPLSASVLSNPSALSNPSTWRPEQESPGPTALLVPTDRPLEDLEQWFPSQSRLRVEKEVVLSGYALYGIRSWYVGSNRASPPTQHTIADHSHTGIFLELMGRSPSPHRRASRLIRWVASVPVAKHQLPAGSVCADSPRSIVISSFPTSTSRSRKAKLKSTMWPTGLEDRSTRMLARRHTERYSSRPHPSTDRKCECQIDTYC